MATITQITVYVDSPLLPTSTQCIVPALPTELKPLDVHGEFASLSNHVDPAHDALIRDSLSVVASFDPATDGDALAQRELAQGHSGVLWCAGN